MSLATRCPACGTAFRVVQDQLKISGGWVRCGQCHQVFNGLESLLDWPVATPPPPPPTALDQAELNEQTTSPIVSAAPSAFPDEAPAQALPAPALPPAPSPEMAAWLDAGRPGHAAPSGATEAAPDLAASRDHAVEAAPHWRGAASGSMDPGFSAAAAEVHTSALPAPSPAQPIDPADEATTDSEESRIPTGIAIEHESVWSRFEAAAAEPVGVDLTRHLPDSTPMAFDPVVRGVPTFRHTAIPIEALPSRFDAPDRPPASEPEAPVTEPEAPAADTPEPGRRKRRRKPAFVRQAERAAQWRRPAVRAVLGGAVAVLSMVLGLQVLNDNRDELASRMPALQPSLALWCGWLNCHLEPPRALARLTLDSSSLSKTGNPQVLRFEADLRNQADHVVRAPALEISFNDLQGRIIVRKVLQADQLAAPAGGLQADASWHIDTRLQVGDLRIAGFSAEVFYP